MTLFEDRRWPAGWHGCVRIFAGFSLVLLLSGCGKTWHEATHEYVQYSIQADLPADSLLEAYLAPLRRQLALTMDDTIAEVQGTLTLQQPESTLGNFLADLLAEEATRITGTPVDLAIQNYGGIRRNSLPKGPLRMGMIYEIMPFDNMLVVLELDASGLIALIEHMAKQGGWPISKDVRYQIREGIPQAILVDHRPIEEGRTYRVAMPDYIAKGGDRCDFLTAYPMTDTGVLVRDAIIQYCRDRQASGYLIDAGLDGRITQIP
ncbi:MAG: 5'-nucleotidase C-terminal domain-containing protein [Saprospiraceae bacterium]|nr:5'-nucleotidase C-terminal domain-containing protein [Saprospiraceae bacterium]